MVNITKEQLQAKNIQELKKIAKQLGVRGTTSGKYRKHNKDQLIDDIIFKRLNILTRCQPKLLLQTKNMQELKQIGKELGIVGVTSHSKYTKDQLIDEIIFRQSHAKDSSSSSSSTESRKPLPREDTAMDEVITITISISCSDKNTVG